jgi:hypothetical protein
MKNKLRFILTVIFITSACEILQAQPARVNLSIIADEPEAVLAIIAKKQANQTITDDDWQRLFTSKGYVRLKKRELAMKRSFEDADFKTFVLSDELSQRAPQLAETLERWKKADISRAGNLALAYLPKSVQIRAKIYPEIKPRSNSFVFDVATDPAIFLYIDPKVTREKFENTLAHELHHIGFGTACPSQEATTAIKSLSQNAQNVFHWVGAFGEGFAMLAAAGGPSIHPHAVSLPDERAEWDKNVANFNADLKTVEQFFLQIAAGELSEEARTSKAVSFYGVQGPWYTVGWRMAMTIENAFGRAKLIECMCNQRLLLPTYNKAVTQTKNSSLALWSDKLISQLK